MKKLIFSLTALLITATLSAQSLSVMSFNLRYDNKGDGENRWDLRKEAVVDCIKDYKPDLLGTQEGLSHQIEYLEEALEGYTRIGVAREDGKKDGEYTAIFFNNSRFEFISNEHSWLSETPNKPTFGWDAACKRLTTVVVLKDKKSGETIHYMNTHFDHEGKEARRQSPRFILNRAAKAAGDGVIFTGDLNAHPDSEPIQIFAKDGSLKDSHLEVKSPKGPKYSYHGFKEEVKLRKEDSIIDYIMYNDMFKVVKYETIDKKYRDRMVSDHFPVYAKLKYSK